MTDRELLELAAKAAGIEGYKFMIGAYAKSDAVGLHIRNYGTSNQRVWNPLTDDGDALRLAVKLGLDVCIDSRQENEPHTHVIGFRDDHTATTIDAIEAHGDPYAATRRAVVRAAAEIGKEMK